MIEKQLREKLKENGWHNYQIDVFIADLYAIVQEGISKEVIEYLNEVGNPNE